MKKLIVLAGIFVLLFSFQGIAQALQPYYSIGSSTKSMDDQITQLKKVVTDGGYKVIGSYHPENNPQLYVLCFTGMLG